MRSHRKLGVGISSGSLVAFVLRACGWETSENKYARAVAVLSDEKEGHGGQKQRLSISSTLKTVQIEVFRCS